MNRRSQAGFSLVEVLVGMVVSSLVLAGAFSLWNTHQREGYRLKKKIELRNVMTLSSKRIQRSVTLAGLGLGGVANLAKSQASGSDTLTIFTNMGESKSPLLANYAVGSGQNLMVTEGSLFLQAGYVAVSNDTNREIRKIVSQSGNTLVLESPFVNAFSSGSTLAYPANRERYYTDQSNQALMHDGNGTTSVVAKDVKNFKVSFRNKNGAATDINAEVRTVVFSFTGLFPAREGALNTMFFTSTAIPRNTL